MEDRLSLMFKLQRELMRKLGVSNGTQYSELFSMEALQAALGIITESAEVMDVINTNSKPWKQKGDDETKEHLLEEIVDVLFFLFELLILVYGVDPTERLLAKFKEKFAIVSARIESSKK